MYNYGSDNKWVIGDDGYYRITVDVFRETIKGEYLGTEVPSDYPQILEQTASVRVVGRQVRVQNCEPAAVKLVSSSGHVCCTGSGTDVVLTAPAKGVYLVCVNGTYSHFTRKAVVK